MKNLCLFLLLFIVIITLYLGCKNTYIESLTNANVVCNSKNGTLFPKINNLLKNVLGPVGPASMVVNPIIQKIEGHCCKSDDNLKKCNQLEQKISSGTVNGINGVIDSLGSEFHDIFVDICNLKIPFVHFYPLEKLSFCKKLTNSSDTVDPNLTDSPLSPESKSPPPGAQSSSSLSCTSWQKTLNCQGNGPIDTTSEFLQTSTHDSDKCDVPLVPEVSGFCTCKDGSKKYFNCGELGGKGQPTNCDDACRGITETHQLIGRVSKPILGTRRLSTPLPPKNAIFIHG